LKTVGFASGEQRTTTAHSHGRLTSGGPVWPGCSPPPGQVHRRKWTGGWDGRLAAKPEVPVSWGLALTDSRRPPVGRGGTCVRIPTAFPPPAWRKCPIPRPRSAWIASCSGRRSRQWWR